MKLYVKAARGEALIGIWWYPGEGTVWGVSCPTDDGVLSGMYLQYHNTKNHMSLWKQVVEDNVADKKEQSGILSKGFKSVERGRVIYNTATMCYEITCSNEIIEDAEFQKAIVAYYQLSGNRYEFVPLQHYHKLELTGNPALDAFIENNDI